MIEIIKWCNDNSGFISAILALLSFFISFWAVVVSIRTARLPYKKAIMLNTSIPFSFRRYGWGGNVVSAPLGINVSATNVGNRAVTLTFVGLAIRDNKHKIQKMYPLDRNLTGTGLLAPSESSSADYNKDELLIAFQKERKNKVIYACAVDSEGKVYLRRRGRVKNAISILRK